MKNLSLFNLGQNPENQKNLKKERIIRKRVLMEWLFQFRISSNRNMKMFLLNKLQLKLESIVEFVANCLQQC